MKKKYFVGIDISKKTLDVVIYSVSKAREDNYLKVSNNPSGFKQLRSWFAKKNMEEKDIHICMEHTGVYGYGISLYLESIAISYSMLSALHLKRSLGIRRGKSDKVDAKAIAYYCYLHREELCESKLRTKELLLIKDLLSERKRYIKEQTAYKGYITEMKGKTVSSTLRRTRESLVRVMQYIQEIEKEILAIINLNGELKRNYHLLCSIVGIGFVNAVYTIVYTNNFEGFTSARSYACYVGVAPFEHTSGTSIRGKTKVSKLAVARLKAELSQAASSAIEHDPELKAYYNRKRKEGKEKGVVKNAVKFKIIQRMFAVIKRQTPFVRIGQFAA